MASQIVGLLFFSLFSSQLLAAHISVDVDFEHDGKDYGIHRMVVDSVSRPNAELRLENDVILRLQVQDYEVHGEHSYASLVFEIEKKGKDISRPTLRVLIGEESQIEVGDTTSEHKELSLKVNTRKL